MFVTHTLATSAVYSPLQFERAAVLPGYFEKRLVLSFETFDMVLMLVQTPFLSTREKSQRTVLAVSFVLLDLRDPKEAKEEGRRYRYRLVPKQNTRLFVSLEKDNELSVRLSVSACSMDPMQYLRHITELWRPEYRCLDGTYDNLSLEALKTLGVATLSNATQQTFQTSRSVTWMSTLVNYQFASQLWSPSQVTIQAWFGDTREIFTTESLDSIIADASEKRLLTVARRVLHHINSERPHEAVRVDLLGVLTAEEDCFRKWTKRKRD